MTGESQRSAAALSRLLVSSGRDVRHSCTRSIDQQLPGAHRGASRVKGRTSLAGLATDVCRRRRCPCRKV